MDSLLYSAIASELSDVKHSHGKTRREALLNLDNIVTRLFPPVPGAPLPSEELNGVADIMPSPSLVGSAAPYLCSHVEVEFVTHALRASMPILPLSNKRFL